MLQRKMKMEELNAVLKGKIPVFDAVFNFERCGLAITVKNCKYGVINRNYQVVLKNMFDEVIFGKNGVIITRENRIYKIYTKDGCLITSREFDLLHKAQKYAEFFA